MNNVILEKTSILEASLDEEDSYYFLSKITNQDFFSYSSKEIPLESVLSSIENFILLHASVSLHEKGLGKFWSPTPIQVFRFVMDSDMGWHHVSQFKPFDGYLVQGCYWTNGFYYLVSYKDFILEASLYVDKETKMTYNYQ
jgi:hypothetical protein